MDRLVALAIAVGAVVAVADARFTGPIAVLVFATTVIAVVAHVVRDRFERTDTDLTMTFVAETPPPRPSVATHDITELAHAFGRGRRGHLPNEIAERVRSIARDRLEDVRGRDVRRGDAEPPVSAALAAVLDGAELRADRLDGILGELERL